MIKIGCYVDAGVSGKRNDDRAAVCGTVLKEGYFTCSRENGVIAAVFDGVGGEAFGNVAAETAARCFAGSDGLRQNEESLRELILDVNRLIIDKQQRDSRFRGMASTASGIYLENDSCLIYNVGDSKVFRYSGGFLQQMTVDDSMGGHVISKWLGMQGLDVNVQRKQFGRGDLFVVCSDGVSDTLSFEEWENILSGYVNREIQTETALRALVKKAIENGSPDNCTVMIVDPFYEDK